MYHVYVLTLKNGDYYIGFASNYKGRLTEHKSGNVKSTRKFLPLKLVTVISFRDKNKALNFEKYLKTGSGIAFRKRHLI